MQAFNVFTTIEAAIEKRPPIDRLCSFGERVDEFKIIIDASDTNVNVKVVVRFLNPLAYHTFLYLPIPRNEDEMWWTLQKAVWLVG